VRFGAISGQIARLVLLWLLTVPGFRAAAIDLEKLVMPGPVIRGHAEVEDQCEKCHEAFRATTQSSLCLSCHDKVHEDVQAHIGFHGRAPAVTRSQCRDCHTDHEGRDANILGLNAESFDHALADFSLEGAHLRVTCDGCHQPKALHRDAPSVCVECHRDVDPHRQRLGNQCESCHSMVDWGAAQFDHTKTNFRLDGRHAESSCELCHANQRYQGTPVACAACHELEDVHRGRLGPSCQECHSPVTWTRSVFDHEKNGGFALEAAHNQLDCRSCHRRDPKVEKLKSECVACHRTDDEHLGRFGSRCEGCHPAVSWTQVAFRHERDTNFPLQGAHGEVRCDRCHRGTLYKDQTGTRCIDCHRPDDVHLGQLGLDCASCHAEEGWARNVFFDHDLSRFPLLGLHALVACEEYHRAGRFKDARVGCVSCHRKDDFHERRMGELCGHCHNSNGWGIWAFDHTSQTSFALHGAHQGLDCHACHRHPSGQQVRVSSRCHDCHAQEDAHSGLFGRTCERCHMESSWAEVTVPR
jgi:hypothetical protein